MPNMNAANDPLEFTRNLWSQMGFSLPGMVTPTFDVEELNKQLADLKTVETWLKMNLSMLQLTIQGLEMQCTTLNTVRDLGNLEPKKISNSARQPATNTSTEDKTNALQQGMWPWALMQQIQAQMQQAMETPSQMKPDQKP